MMAKRIYGGFAAVAVASALALYAHDRLDEGELPDERAAPQLRYRTDLPDDWHERALSALATDAHEREDRFRDAAEPGQRFAATRVSAQELARWEPSQLFDLGARLFHHRFEPRDGYGGADTPGLPPARVHRGARGGPDAFSCVDCHRRGGPAGGGDAADNVYLDGDGVRPASGLERNAPALVGAGLVELLAREMSVELAEQREALLRSAGGGDASAELVSKGVSFGTLAVRAGKLDTSALDGVSTDLVVRPFGWKGHAASLSEVVSDELALHHGMQTSRQTKLSPEVAGPFGGDDPDGDGIVNEIGDGQWAALIAFVAMQEVPVVEPAAEPRYALAWAAGRDMFRSLGCADCHVPSLPLDDATYTVAVGGTKLTIDLAAAGADPRIAVGDDGRYHVQLYSDLKRHKIGDNEPRGYRGVTGAEVRTPPLWGVARSRPYWHDASAPTIELAILAHAGEAKKSRDAYAKLTDEEKAPLRLLLASLTRAHRLVVP